MDAKLSELRESGFLGHWGDYGRLLVHGMSMHLSRENGIIRLERTGPYIPPISFPGVGTMVVTSRFREKLEKSGLRGMHFLPVIKARIVRLDWHLWDQTLMEPPIFPDSGEPEDYILGDSHSAECADEMGELWELVLEVKAKIMRKPMEGSYGEEIFLIKSSCPDLDLFRADGVLYNFATGAAKAWFTENAPEWVSLKPAKII